jgi:TonB family protein
MKRGGRGIGVVDQFEFVLKGHGFAACGKTRLRPCFWVAQRFTAANQRRLKVGAEKNPVPDSCICEHRPAPKSLNFESGCQIVASMTTRKAWLKIRRWTVMLPFALVASLAGGQQSQGQPAAGQTAPRAIFVPDPDYTAEAAQKGIRGKVYLAVEILPKGRTNNVRVTKGLDPSLDQSAVETVARWRFQPATKNGTPGLAEMNVILEFPWPNPNLSSQAAIGAYWPSLRCEDRFS